MNKQEILDEINKTKEHLADMEKMLEESQDERWQPKELEKYYYLSYNLEVWSDTNHNNLSDEEAIRVYNCFRTKEEAKKEAENILVRRMLECIAKRLNKGEKIDWYNNDQSKYYIELYCDEIITNFFNSHKIQGTVYCLDGNFLDVVIKEIGEERLKKYLRDE